MQPLYLMKWRMALPLLVLWLAFGLRLYHLDFQSIWWDEGHSLFVASHPIPQIPVLPAMDVHPPAYFAWLHLWISLTGSSEFTLRYLSVCFSLLTVALLWRFAAAFSLEDRPPTADRRPPKGIFITPGGPQSRENSSRLLAPPPLLRQAQDAAHSSAPLLPRPPAPLLAAFLAAISPLYVAYAQEVRSYAMITFLAAASTFVLWNIFFGVVSSRWSVVATYVLLTAACLYTHYFTIFLLLFHNLAWLVWVLAYQQRRSRFRPDLLLWAGSQLGILLLFTPQLLLALRQITGYTNPNLIPPTLAEFILRSWQAYTTGLTIDSTAAYWGMAAVGGVLVITWLLLFVSALFHALRSATSPPQLPPPSSPPVTATGGRPFTIHHSLFTIHHSLFTIHYSLSSLLFLTGWFLIPLAGYYLVLQRQPSFEPRYLILVTPPLFLLLALGLTKFQYSTHYVLRITFYVLLTFTLLPLLVGLYSYYTNESYFKDDSAGVTAWLVAETTPADLLYVDVPHPFHYYAERIPAPSRYLFVDIHTAADTLTSETTGRKRLFWLTWRGSDTDPRGVIPFLAQKYGQKLGERDFRGYHLEWYSLPPAPTAFSLPVSLNPLEATFGEVLRLDGAAFGGSPAEGATIGAGHSAWATLHFTLRRDTEVNYKVSLRLRGADGSVVSQLDKDLLNDRHFRTAAWPMNDPALNQAINVYTLPVPVETAPGPYRLEVVVYNAEPPYPGEGVTGPAASPDGMAAVVGTVTVTP